MYIDAGKGPLGGKIAPRKTTEFDDPFQLWEVGFLGLQHSSGSHEDLSPKKTIMPQRKSCKRFVVEFLHAEVLQVCQEHSHFPTCSHFRTLHLVWCSFRESTRQSLFLDFSVTFHRARFLIYKQYELILSKQKNNLLECCQEGY